MARGGKPGFLERHVEKLLVLVCLIILAVVAALWVVGPAGKVEVAGPGPAGNVMAIPVLPSLVDQTLRDAARRVEAVNSQRPKDLPPPEDYRRGFEQRQRLPATAMSLPALVPNLGRDLRELWPPEFPGATLANFQAPAPTKPLAFPGVFLLEADLAADLRDVPMVFLLATVPWRQLQRAWTQALLGTVVDPKVLMLRVVVEAQRLGPDGTWGEPRVVEPLALPPEVPPEDVLEGLALYQPPKLPVFTGENAKEIHAAVEKVEELGKGQIPILCPRFPKLWQPGAGRGFVNWTNLVPWMALGFERPGPDETPDLKSQLARGGVLVWANDTKAGIGSTYRYRFQLVLVNPLYARPEVVTKGREDQAKILEAPTPPGPWSDPVVAPRLTEMFLVGALERQGVREARVAVFRQSLGRMVAENFNVTPGQLVGGIRVLEQVAPIRPQQPQDHREGLHEMRPVGPEKRAVDFATQAVVMELVPNRPIMGGAGWRRTTELVCRDADGQLKRMVVVGDLPSDHPDRKRFEQLSILVKQQPVEEHP